mgnify:CR=1 FL=1
MGLISRLRRITRGRIEAFLDAIEDPAAVVPVLIDELAAQVTAAANAEAKALTAVKASRRRLDEAAGKAARMGQAAELAVQAGKEDLARQAVAMQLQAETDQAAAAEAVQTAESAHAEARSVRVQLASELERLRARKGELIARARQAKADKRCPARAADGKRLLDEVARMEEKIVTGEIAAEADAETAALLGEQLSGDQVEKLLRDQEVQRRLDQLRKDMQQGG